jgi:2-succinyl-5-enolpyruvyl-6-hydroxy-3-cyclohexene-1-carboxylate synthase
VSDTALLNLRWAHTLVDALAHCGLHHAVISPGSRSTPLALACERHAGLETWIQVDERSAAFFALGLSRMCRQPVALIATSGTAPAHWYPAVIEANFSAVPLILLSADRPPELQNCGANQTIDQNHLFGTQVRSFYPLPPPSEDALQFRAVSELAVRAVTDSLAALPGPVHLNVPFREPLVPALDGLPATVVPIDKPAIAAVLPEPDFGQLDQLARSLDGKTGIIVCGPEQHATDFTVAVTALSKRLAAPVLADPLSGLRFGVAAPEQIITRYDAFLRRESFTSDHSPEWVLRFGAFPVSRHLSSYLEKCERSRHYLVDTHGRRRDPLHLTSATITAAPAVFCRLLAERVGIAADQSWLDAFRREEMRAARLVLELPTVESAVIRQCISQLPEGSALFSSNSMCIRDLDSFSGSGRKTLQLVANRGASGIDGNLSTLLGLAAGYRGPGMVAGFIGDLAFIHDMNGLIAARDQNVLIILFNNGGGHIFSYLPQAALAEFERGWLTPIPIDFAKVADIHGIAHQRITSAEQFPAAMNDALQRAGSNIIEVAIDGRESLAAHHRYWDRVSAE